MSPQTLSLLVQSEHSANQVSDLVHTRRDGGGGASIKPKVGLVPSVTDKVMNG